MIGTGTGGVESNAYEPRRRTDVLLSVVIVTFNCRALTVACLDSLVAEMSFFPNHAIEILIVNNGSTDGTVEAIRQHRARPHVSISAGNPGFAAANNQAIAAASGRYVLLLNPDTVVGPGALVSALHEIARQPDIGMLGAKLLLPDGTLDHACKRGFPTPLSSLGYFLRLDRFVSGEHPLGGYRGASQRPDTAEDVDAISGAFMLVRREALEAVGPLDEAYWMYSEDLDWCARFRKAGWRVFYWPSSVVLHVKGGSGGHRSFRTNLAFHRGMIRFHRIHGNSTPLGTLVVALAVWLRMLCSVAVGLIRGAFRPPEGASPT